VRWQVNRIYGFSPPRLRDFLCRQICQESQPGRNLNYWALWTGYKCLKAIVLVKPLVLQPLHKYATAAGFRAFDSRYRMRIAPFIERSDLVLDGATIVLHTNGHR